MSFTRIHDDPNRVKKQMEILTKGGRYSLNAPGNGLKPCYMEDPYMRMQKWGGNLRTNTINIESDLKGLSRRINNRDNVNKDDYKKNSVTSSEIQYPTCKSFTEQTRATHPAWEVRDKEQARWCYLHEDPQNMSRINMPFDSYQSSRILEKDLFDKKCK
tara:strand:+ start:102 stop:578 length:477 start_codon:yes stop_codon:yes gene_type:complete